MTDRHTAAERQEQGIADVLRERDALREQVEYLVRAGHKQLERADAAEDALAALVAASVPVDQYANEEDGWCYVCGHDFGKDSKDCWRPAFTDALAAARKAVGE